MKQCRLIFLINYCKNNNSVNVVIFLPASIEQLVAVLNVENALYFVLVIEFSNEWAVIDIF